jgi:hypothetical protein
MVFAVVSAAAHDVNSLVLVTRSDCSYEPGSNTAYVSVVVTNRGHAPLRLPLALEVTDISSAEVRLISVDGRTPEGHPFVIAGTEERLLAPGRSTRSTLLQFDNPGRAPFTYHVTAFDNLTPAQIELATASSDMRGPHEGRPHGVPSNDIMFYKDSEMYDWYWKPRVNLQSPPIDWKAALPWGQIYEAAEGSRAHNVRVEIRDLQLLGLNRATGQWSVLQYSGAPGGSFYREDFANDDHVAGTQNIDCDSQDNGRSVRMMPGRVFHFFGPRLHYDQLGPPDMPMMTRFRARLVLDESAGTDDRSQARFLANAAGDYWVDDVPWRGTFRNNRDFAISRFKYLAAEYRTFYAHNLNPSDLLRYPPPPMPTLGRVGVCQ